MSTRLIVLKASCGIPFYPPVFVMHFIRTVGGVLQPDESITSTIVRHFVMLRRVSRVA